MGWGADCSDAQVSVIVSRPPEPCPGLGTSLHLHQGWGCFSKTWESYSPTLAITTPSCDKLLLYPPVPVVLVFP